MKRFADLQTGCSRREKRPPLFPLLLLTQYYSFACCGGGWAGGFKSQHGRDHLPALGGPRDPKFSLVGVGVTTGDLPISTGFCVDGPRRLTAQ